MKLTESMLRDYVTTSKSVEEVSDLLTMVGFELEEITEVEGEKVMDINIMANRGDGASVIGLCREILAKDRECKPTELYSRLVGRQSPPDGDDSAINSHISVEIETEDCTRYACRVFEGLTNGPSPGWIQERLRKIGQRPISLLVDLTNYVMIETGQPLHAFDLDKLAGPKIVVRKARDGESMTTLDGVSHKLNSQQMMICDAERPVAVAGVMGGEDTEVSDSTTRCLLESAHFDHRSVRRTSKQIGLKTDASYRFERYVDPEGVIRAIERFTELLRIAIGINPVAGIIDVYPTKPVRNAISVRTERCARLLGMDVTAQEVKTYLTDLGSSVAEADGGFSVTPPTWRIDLEREEDYVEEVGRMHGYERIPEALPVGSTPVGGTYGLEALIDRVREELLRCGINQAISHSLRDVHPLDRDTGRIRVRDPHSPEIALLRNSILPSVSDAALKNGAKDIHLFEVGHVFDTDREFVQLGVLMTGSMDSVFWGVSGGETADLFVMKGVVERLFESVNVSYSGQTPAHADPRLHPTRQASLPGVGVFGQIHPDFAGEAGLPVDTFLAELDMTALSGLEEEERHFQSVYRNPAARRDIAVTVSKSVPYSSIEAAVSAAAGDVLEKQWLFDVYEGKGIEPGHHSLAIAIQLRKAGNFTDEEANQVRDSVVKALEGLGAKLR